MGTWDRKLQFFFLSCFFSLWRRFCVMCLETVKIKGNLLSSFSSLGSKWGWNHLREKKKKRNHLRDNILFGILLLPLEGTKYAGPLFTVVWLSFSEIARFYLKCTIQSHYLRIVDCHVISPNHFFHSPLYVVKSVCSRTWNFLFKAFMCLKENSSGVASSW